MKTLFVLLTATVLLSCASNTEDATVEVTDTLNMGDTAVEMLDTIGDSISVMREAAEIDAAGQR